MDPHNPNKAHQRYIVVADDRLDALRERGEFYLLVPTWDQAIKTLFDVMDMNGCGEIDLRDSHDWYSGRVFFIKEGPKIADGYYRFHMMRPNRRAAIEEAKKRRNEDDNAGNASNAT